MMHTVVETVQHEAFVAHSTVQATFMSPETEQLEKIFFFSNNVAIMISQLDRANWNIRFENYLKLLTVINKYFRYIVSLGGWLFSHC